MTKQQIFTRYASSPDAVPGLEAIPGLLSDLRQCDSPDQADAVVEMKACQIAQTGWAGKGSRATRVQLEWARGVDALRSEREAQEHVPGTCPGCNSLPCCCLA